MRIRSKRPSRWLTAVLLCAAFGLTGQAHAQVSTPSLEAPISEQEAAQREAARSQQRIDQLDDETRIALEQYRESMRQVDQLTTYNTQMERMVESQTREIGALERQINEIEVTQRQILPLMRQMLDVLEQLVDSDAPFLLDERKTRIKDLNAMMQQAGTPLADKFRRLFEAWQIEMEYGHTIEAYRAELPRSNGQKTVELLRIGRTALYYMTLDEREAGIWDVRSNSWQTLPNNNVPLIKQGLRLARKELPPDLIRLPVAAPEAGS
jgi:septal ring factor EnvC (AmiA/AmiB activator)